MTQRTLAIGLLIAGLSGAAWGQDQAPPQTVAQLDLERYLGRWQELARIPNSFQDQCTGITTATYSAREDGQLQVLNACITADGSLDQAVGRARIDPAYDDPARLQVSFAPLGPLRWLAAGAYWVIGLADDYSYAVIGHPERSYGWLLARDSSLAHTTLAAIDGLLRAQGYDPCRFVMTPSEDEAFADGTTLCSLTGSQAGAPVMPAALAAEGG
ncbi:MAG: lipocalin family protein [Geminicoccaceae bacterium]